MSARSVVLGRTEGLSLEAMDVSGEVNISGEVGGVHRYMYDREGRKSDTQ